MTTNKEKSIPPKNEESTFLDIADGIITSKQDESLLLNAAPTRKRFGRYQESQDLSHQASTTSEKEEMADKIDMATKKEETNKDLEKSGEKVSDVSGDDVVEAEQLQPRVLKAAPSRRRFGNPEQKPQPDLLQPASDHKRSANKRPS